MEQSRVTITATVSPPVARRLARCSPRRILRGR